ncbi:hypothetical protein G3T14_05385 [Methylobacterium sp. BTF04]|uniref:HNH endonuclease n=1 Tax=Methylobacterium sp. BTF04 TaxID=2708300 RepID=UPI0013CF96CF|nr:HNH endonuclease [Methylobacterium sp. BTF04]NEU11559.1 hypothetical protein [Methylobacterium sp. BTF04]
MTILDDIKPQTKRLVIDLLTEAGIDTSHWSDYKGKNASQHPNYYNWSFEKPDELVIVSIWHSDLELEGDKVVHRKNIRIRDGRNGGKGKVQWKVRAEAFDGHIQKAFTSGLPVRAILCEGNRREIEELEPISSKVSFRELDPEPWAVSYYNFETGDCVITRGELPTAEIDHDQPEFSGFEGELRRRFVLHRRREAQLRRKKLLAATYENNGHLICEVPRCGFDFKARYGAIGEGFAHVHHLVPLAKSDPKGRNTSLKDLAIVCANCHAMIHAGGQCRSLEYLIEQ